MLQTTINIFSIWKLLSVGSSFSLSSSNNQIMHTKVLWQMLEKDSVLGMIGVEKLLHFFWV